MSKHYTSIENKPGNNANKEQGSTSCNAFSNGASLSYKDILTPKDIPSAFNFQLKNSSASNQQSCPAGSSSFNQSSSLQSVSDLKNSTSSLLRNNSASAIVSNLNPVTESDLSIPSCSSLNQSPFNASSVVELNKVDWSHSKGFFSLYKKISEQLPDLNYHKLLTDHPEISSDLNIDLSILNYCDFELSNETKAKLVVATQLYRNQLNLEKPNETCQSVEKPKVLFYKNFCFDCNFFVEYLLISSSKILRFFSVK